MVVITIVINGCATNNLNSHSTKQIDAPNMASILDMDLDVFFQLENERFSIKSAVKEMPNDLANNKMQDNDKYYCVNIHKNGYSTCKNALKNDIYLSRQIRDAGGVVSGVVTLPIAAALDVLDGLSTLTPSKSRKSYKGRKSYNGRKSDQGKKPYEAGSNTINSLSKMEVDADRVNAIGAEINNTIYQDYKMAVGGTDIALIDSFISKYPIVKDSKIIFDKLISSYRLTGSFDGYLKAFQESGNVSDMKQAYMKAETPQQKVLAEKTIVNALPVTKIFNIEVLERAESALRNDESSGIFHAVKGQVKDIQRTIKVSVRKDIPFPIKYGDYKVSLDIKEMLDYEPPINGAKNDFVESKLSFSLNQANQWTEQKAIAFTVPVFGTYRPAGVGAINFLSGLMGGPKVSAESFDIDFKLKGSKLEYVVGAIE